MSILVLFFLIIFRQFAFFFILAETIPRCQIFLTCHFILYCRLYFNTFYLCIYLLPYKSGKKTYSPVKFRISAPGAYWFSKFFTRALIGWGKLQEADNYLNFRKLRNIIFFMQLYGANKLILRYLFISFNITKNFLTPNFPNKCGALKRSERWFSAHSNFYGVCLL